MSVLTKEELKWIKKVQKALNECPSDRFGFYTTGDNYVTIYDRKEYYSKGLDDYITDPALIIDEHDLVLSELFFTNNVEGLCG